MFMLLLGISLSIGGAHQRIFKGIAFLTSHAHGGIISAGLGLLISLIYWLGYSLFLSLGYAGSIPPVIAPWFVPTIFSAISAYLYRQIPE
jgi:lipopolysaccharide export system permease protein